MSQAVERFVATARHADSRPLATESRTPSTRNASCMPQLESRSTNNPGIQRPCGFPWREADSNRRHHDFSRVALLLSRSDLQGFRSYRGVLVASGVSRTLRPFVVLKGPPAPPWAFS